MPKEFHRLSCVRARMQQSIQRLFRDACRARRFMYYLSKYWELLDSVFQVQKARSLGPKGTSPGFLHYYHHAAVMVFRFHPTQRTSCVTRPCQVMCLNWIESNQTLQWLGLAFNTFVHVIM